MSEATIDISTDIVPLTGLAKTDIAALRKADDVYAVLHEGEHKLRCIKRVDWRTRETDPFAQDVRVDIPCEGRVTNYEKGEKHGLDFQGFAAVYGSDGIWEILRPGDRITLDWVRGNYSPFLHENAPNVGVDHLTIRLKHGKKDLRFLAAYQAGAKNSARLIRTRSEGFV